MTTPHRSILLATVPLLLPASSAAQVVTRVSTAPGGAQVAGVSSAPASAGDYRVQVFVSNASTLVAGDTNGFNDVFLKDPDTGVVTLVSRGLGGAPANGASRAPSLSGDTTWVAFESDASNLVAGDTNGATDVFVWERFTGVIERVSVGALGEGNDYSFEPSISLDGSVVAFTSKATNLVASDTNSVLDVFVRFRASGLTKRVQAGTLQPNSHSRRGKLSGSGGELAFDSDATNLVAGDGNGASDVFVADTNTGAIVLASAGPSGGSANGASRAPAMSTSGVMVVFESDASNLTAGDTNGLTDVYAYNVPSQSLTRVSLRADSGEPSGRSFAPGVSGNGAHVAYCSDASDILPGDTNASTDVYFTIIGSPGTSEIVSRGATATCGNGASRAPALDWFGEHVAFESTASNLIAGDTNGQSDVYLRYRVTRWFAYCASGTTTNGCTATISAYGAASVSSAAQPFTITASQVEGQRSGLIFYSAGATMLPWGTGGTSFLCLAAPTQRSVAANSGGTSGTCTGTLSLDFNAWMQSQPSALGSPFTAGDWLYAQAWFRDPGVVKKTSLSNALTFELGW
jgi:Tol biopolymer transport system component